MLSGELTIVDRHRVYGPPARLSQALKETIQIRLAATDIGPQLDGYYGPLASQIIKEALVILYGEVAIRPLTLKELEDVTMSAKKSEEDQSASKELEAGQNKPGKFRLNLGDVVSKTDYKLHQEKNVPNAREIADQLLVGENSLQITRHTLDQAKKVLDLRAKAAVRFHDNPKVTWAALREAYPLVEKVFNQPIVRLSTTLLVNE